MSAFFPVDIFSYKPFHFELVKPDRIDQNLLEKFQEIASDGFGKHIEMSGVRRNTIETDGVFVAYVGHLYEYRPIGFSSHKVFEGGGIGYLCGVVFEKEFQSRGLFKRIFKEQLETVFAQTEYVTARTQNPRIYSSLSDLLEKVYPEPDGDVPEEIVEVAKRINSDTPDDLLFRGVYGEQLTAERVYSDDSEVNGLFERLETEKGDAFLLVGLVK